MAERGTLGYRQGVLDTDLLGRSSVQSGLGILQAQNMMRQMAYEDQAHPLKLQAMQRADEEAKLMNGILGRYLASQGGAGAPGGVLSGGGAQGIAPQGIAPQDGALPSLTGSSGLSLPPGVQMELLHPKLKALGTANAKAYEPTQKMRELVARGVQPGSPQWNAELGTNFTQSGAWQTDASGNVDLAPGYARGQGAIKGAEVAPQFADVTIGGRPYRMTNAEYADLHGQDQLKAVQVAQRYGIPYNGGVVDQPRPQITAPQGPAPQEQTLPPLGGAPAAQPGASGLGRIPTANVVGGGRLPVNPTQAESAADKERAIADTKREYEAPQGGLQTGTQLDSFKRLTDMATQVLDAPGLAGATGIRGAFPSFPGSNATSAEAKIESLKAQVSGMKLQAMRDASKTGGAVGNVTEKEWPRLESMIVALNPKLDKESFKKQVNNLINEILISERRISDAYKQEYGNTRGAVPPNTREGGLSAAEQSELANLRARFKNGR